MRGCCGDRVTGADGGHDEKLRWELSVATGVKAGVWEVAREGPYRAAGGRRRRKVGVIEQHELAQVELYTPHSSNYNPYISLCVVTRLS